MAKEDRQYAVLKPMYSLVPGDVRGEADLPAEAKELIETGHVRHLTAEEQKGIKETGATYLEGVADASDRTRVAREREKHLAPLIAESRKANPPASPLTGDMTALKPAPATPTTTPPVAQPATEGGNKP